MKTLKYLLATMLLLGVCNLTDVYKRQYLDLPYAITAAPDPRLGEAVVLLIAPRSCETVSPPRVTPHMKAIMSDSAQLSCEEMCIRDRFGVGGYGQQLLLHRVLPVGLPSGGEDAADIAVGLSLGGDRELSAERAFLV